MLYRRLIPLALAALCCLQAHAQNLCSPYVVRGTYVVSYRGSVYQFMDDGKAASVALPVVLLGVATVDPYTGTLSGRGTVTVGQQTMKLQFSGTVEIRPDCTATATYYLQPDFLPAPSPVPVKEEWVVLKEADRVRVIVTNFPFGLQVTMGTWERISYQQTANGHPPE